MLSRARITCQVMGRDVLHCRNCFDCVTQCPCNVVKFACSLSSKQWEFDLQGVLMNHILTPLGEFSLNRSYFWRSSRTETNYQNSFFDYSNIQVRTSTTPTIHSKTEFVFLLIFNPFLLHILNEY